jgi:hypothetical protein
MNLERSKDTVGAIALLIIAAGYYFASTDILDTGLSGVIGARALPTGLAIVLALLALAMLVRALAFAASRKVEVDADKEAEALPLRALGLLAIGALYIPLATWLGYVPAIFLLLCAVTLYEGAKPSWRVFAIAACGALFFWLLFVAFLGVAQPPGRFF